MVETTSGGKNLSHLFACGQYTQLLLVVDPTRSNSTS